ncbi:uncharacterized protein LOC128720893 [Anopheles nili]|uniref:uncharacterized protein LOC128720893 n=1 Tax=Anopheles nili TaxID=185578 RepID=UPI00237C4124|nr:uncharacterized protein LOC128720893 [Anopheles nili]
MLLEVALLLSTLVLRLDGRFVEISKQPPGTVAIVPNDEDGESVLLGPVFHDSQELDRETGNEMISVKLLNQYRTRSIDNQQGDTDTILVGDGARSRPTLLDYDNANHLEGNGNDLNPPYFQQPPVEAEEIDMKENGIEDDLVPTEPILDTRLLDAWPQLAITGNSVMDSGNENNSPDSIGSKSTTLTTMTTSTTTRTTTVRKIQRKTRQQVLTTLRNVPQSTSTQRSTQGRATSVPRPTPTSHRPQVPRIDISKLNLEHLESELVAFPTLIPPQALAYSSSSSSTRLLPRSIKPEQAPACGCQHRKRSVRRSQHSSEEFGDPAGDYDDYDYDYNDLRKVSVNKPLASRPMFLPAMSRLLAPGSAEPLESSIERAEKVHGTLERLMGIVTIFSHVDEFIQKKTKQSIRRLARLYESEEFD